MIGKTTDMNLIGQFGVGFYSAFLVANKVVVFSKTPKEPDQHVWISTADGKFSVSKDPRGNTLKRGTQIVLHLKEDAIEYVEQDKIKELVRRYSQFINYPIYLWVTKDVTKQIDEADYDDDINTYQDPTEEEIEKDIKKAEEEKKQKDDVEVTEESDDAEKDDEKEKAPEEPKKKTITETIWTWDLVNDAKAIWLRPKEEIEEKEYAQFYKSITKDNEDPLTYTHFSAEGDIDFKSILFIPSHASYDMFDNYYGKNGQMKLYVRKVLISDQFEDLMPRYLNFISGVVHSDDLPLNVSRE